MTETYKYESPAFFCHKADAPILIRGGKPIHNSGYVIIRKSVEFKRYVFNNCVLDFDGHINFGTEECLALEKMLKDDASIDEYINELVFKYSGFPSIMDGLKIALIRANSEGHSEMASKMQSLLRTPRNKLIHWMPY